uniref:ADF-H domain-containing protein n=1 Tax=Acanthochromis polyacanthus TaxID=80966 RepID=A0A3Q1FQD2_9TELE
MSVNLSKNGAALMAAYKDVVDGKSDKNWALFTYEGNSNDLRLAQTGGSPCDHQRPRRRRRGTRKHPGQSGQSFRSQL